MGASPRRRACRSGRGVMYSMRTRTWSRCCAERGALLGEQIYRHSYPHCWRSKTPVVFRAVEQFFIRIEAIRAQALAAIDTVQLGPRMGAQPHLRHGRVAARLVHLAPALMGRAAAGLLRRGRQADARCRAHPAGRRSLRAARRRISGLKKTTRGGRETLCAARGLHAPQRYAGCLDRLRRLPSGRGAQAARRRARRCLSRGHRPAPRVVPILAHDQRRAARRCAVQDVRHARFRRGQGHAQEGLEVRPGHLRQADGRGAFRRQVRGGYRPALGVERGVHQRGAVLRGVLRAAGGCLPAVPQCPAHPARKFRRLRATRPDDLAGATLIDRWMRSRLQQVSSARAARPTRRSISARSSRRSTSSARWISPRSTWTSRRTASTATPPSPRAAAQRRR